MDAERLATRISVPLKRKYPIHKGENIIKKKGIGGEKTSDSEGEKGVLIYMWTLLVVF